MKEKEDVKKEMVGVDRGNVLKEKKLGFKDVYFYNQGLTLSPAVTTIIVIAVCVYFGWRTLYRSGSGFNYFWVIIGMVVFIYFGLKYPLKITDKGIIFNSRTFFRNSTIFLSWKDLESFYVKGRCIHFKVKPAVIAEWRRKFDYIKLKYSINGFNCGDEVSEYRDIMSRYLTQEFK